MCPLVNPVGTTRRGDEEPKKDLCVPSVNTYHMSFDRLKHRLDDEAMTCPKCKYEDTEGEWQSEKKGKRVLYRHVCPSCGAVDKRTMRNA